MYKWDENFLFDIEYEVLNRFKNVINLTHNDKIYSVFNQHLKQAPFSIILPKVEFLSLLNSEKTRITFRPRSGDEYSSKIIVNHEKMKTKNFLLISKALMSFPKIDNPFEDHFQKMRKEKKYEKLIGLGIGLTPSGDDYLLGLIATYLNKGLFIPNKILTIVLNGKKKTNILSWNFLQNSINGLFIQEIIDFFREKNSNNFLKNINQVLRIGSSSGRDILLGIYDALKIIEGHQDN